MIHTKQLRILHTLTAFDRKQLYLSLGINGSWVYIFDSNALTVRWNFRWKKSIMTYSKAFFQVKKKAVNSLLNHNWGFPSRQCCRVNSLPVLGYSRSLYEVCSWESSWRAWGGRGLQQSQNKWLCNRIQKTIWCKPDLISYECSREHFPHKGLSKATCI